MAEKLKAITDFIIDPLANLSIVEHHHQLFKRITKERFINHIIFRLR